MSLIHAEIERVIGAPAPAVYAFLADYHECHLLMAPADCFFDVIVLAGGAGALMLYRFLSAGREHPYRLRVSAPRLGTPLVERDEVSTMVMTYAVTPDDDGVTCRVKITGEWRSADGIEGIMERTFAPAELRSIYAQELTLLDAAVKQ